MSLMAELGQGPAPVAGLGAAGITGARPQIHQHQSRVITLNITLIIIIILRVKIIIIIMIIAVTMYNVVVMELVSPAHDLTFTNISLRLLLINDTINSLCLSVGVWL